MLTGYQEFEYAREAIKLGVKDYISKPIHYGELEMKIREIGEEIRKKRAKEKYYSTVSLIDEAPNPEAVKKTPEQLVTSALEYINTHMGQDLGIEELGAFRDQLQLLLFIVQEPCRAYLRGVLDETADGGGQVPVSEQRQEHRADRLLCRLS